MFVHAVQNTNVDGGITKASWNEHSNTIGRTSRNSLIDKSGHPDRENSIYNNPEILNFS